MTAQPHLVSDAAADAVATPSGKGRGTENFPVGSMLIRPDLRRHVHRFYRFARTADDIADNPALSPADKIARLDRMAAALDGAADPGAAVAVEMAASLAETGVTPRHCHDLLTAFRQDAVKQRYDDWADLMNYCRYSASPVGRYLLDLHGEDRATWDASDALCDALQVLNHLQDCAIDYREMDRVYLPAETLAASGAGLDDLKAAAAGPGLRRCLDRLLDGVEELARRYRPLASGIRDPRMRGEAAAITVLADRLTARLRRGDPVATRVKLSRTDFAVAGLTGLRAALLGVRR
jgi:squalene synthase HpnC